MINRAIKVVRGNSCKDNWLNVIVGLEVNSSKLLTSSHGTSFDKCPVSELAKAFFSNHKVHVFCGVRAIGIRKLPELIREGTPRAINLNLDSELISAIERGWTGNNNWVVFSRLEFYFSPRRK